MLLVHRLSRLCEWTIVPCRRFQRKAKDSGKGHYNVLQAEERGRVEPKRRNVLAKCNVMSV